jgi:crotonobetainyl-CoA:carnitine CoA-transferase CaiB-like acyl-CoA transferase
MELGQVLAVPFASALLQILGGLIKVEMPGTVDSFGDGDPVNGRFHLVCC